MKPRFFQRANHTEHDKSYPSHLNPRFEPEETADDVLWERVSCKGARLVAAMLDTDEDAGKRIRDTRTPPSAASIWQGDLKDDLAKWGWTEFPTDDLEELYRGDHYGFWHVGSVTKALKIGGHPGPNNVIRHVEHCDKSKKDPKGNELLLQEQYYQVDGKGYRATGARYLFVVNHNDGVIYAQYITSPMHATRLNWYRSAEHKELPLLNKLSDVLWGYWFRDNTNVRNIKYFWVQEVANFDTNKVIAGVLKEAGKEISAWPGVTFDMKSTVGQAMLGSDNGASFAWFLIQHKAQLGIKWISKVSIFLNDNNQDWTEPHLIFHVKDAPSPQQPRSTKKRSRQISPLTEPRDMAKMQFQMETREPQLEQRGPNNFRRIHMAGESMTGGGEVFGNSDSQESMQHLYLPINNSLSPHEENSHQLTDFSRDASYHTQQSEAISTELNLTRRYDINMVADDSLWNEAVCRGRKLVAAMISSDEAAGRMYQDTRTPPSLQSEWKGDLKEELQKWGWNENSANTNLVDFEGYWAYGKVFKALKLNGLPKTRGGDNIPYFTAHGDPRRSMLNPGEYEVDGKNYQYTGGKYIGGVNPVGGAIFSLNVISPAAIVKGSRNPPDLPALRAMSDVIWGWWNRDNPDIKNIKTFWMLGIVNLKTHQIISRALKSKGKTVQEKWPGTEFSMDSEEGQAILGSPNGAVFGHFLVRHKAELGQKWISKVVVGIFDQDVWDLPAEALAKLDPNLIFFVEDVPSGKEVPELKEPSDGSGAVVTPFKANL